MNKVFTRNYILFVVMLVGCASTLGYFLVSSDSKLRQRTTSVDNIHAIITKAEQVSGLVEGMLAAQRGYIISGQEEFLNTYEAKKAGVSESIASLSELTTKSPAQQSRLDELRDYFVRLSSELETRAMSLEPMVPYTTLEGVESINSIRENIARVTRAVLNEAHASLNERVRTLELQRTRYLNALLAGLIVGCALLLVLNGFLLNAQQRRSRIEANLKDAETRFELAVDGTQDGIFDWDMIGEKVFYSRRFFQMLGFDKEPYYGSINDLTDLIHPEDLDKFWLVINQYLRQEISEYTQDFRMRHRSGRWVWIRSRGKAIFDDRNGPVRMVGAHSDISHIVQREEWLLSEKEKAEGASRAKSEFLAHMSHEIRTPLTAISGVVEILDKQRDRLDEKQVRLVATLRSSATSLKDLVNDVLDFSKIESGDIEIEQEPFLLETLFDDIISIMSLRASEKRINFLCDHSAVEGKQFLGDRGRLRQICINLIGNAIKFTDSGSVTVTVGIEDQGAEQLLRVDVTDTGIGIAAEDFDLVFERFKQADSSVSRKFGGTGLGLPISKNLARLMGGEIFVSSTLGVGSTFSLLVPFRADQGLMTAPSQDQELGSINQQIRSRAAKSKGVLVVDDYDGNVVVISYLLSELELPYDVAKTGLEALACWEQKDYDVVLMDIQMPEMDGFTAARVIRRQEAEQGRVRVPIVGMTAHALAQDGGRCIQAGMDAYLSKPLVEVDFKRVLLKFLESEEINSSGNSSAPERFVSGGIEEH